MSWSSALSAGLTRRFDAARDPVRASDMAAYMRGQFAFCGIPAPARRAALRSALDDAGPPGPGDAIAFAATAWRRREREWQYAACDVLRREGRALPPASLDRVGLLVRARSWWDTADALAPVAGDLVRAHPGLSTTMDEWIDDDDFWVARVALLHQLSYGAATDAARLFGYCARRAGDREFFVRKAIGWALRTYARTDRPAVEAFVEEHRQRLSALSVREALLLRGQSNRRSGS